MQLQCIAMWERQCRGAANIGKQKTFFKVRISVKASRCQGTPSEESGFVQRLSLSIHLGTANYPTSVYGYLRTTPFAAQATDWICVDPKPTTIHFEDSSQAHQFVSNLEVYFQSDSDIFAFCSLFLSV